MGRQKQWRQEELGSFRYKTKPIEKNMKKAVIGRVVWHWNPVLRMVSFLFPKCFRVCFSGYVSWKK